MLGEAHARLRAGGAVGHLARRATVAATVARWDALGCGYYAALALHDSDCDDHLREAITRFEALGADAAARRTRQRMKELGHRASRPVPARAPGSTRSGSPDARTRCWLLLCEGLTNDEIAARLVVSTRTVDHHVSAVLVEARGGLARRPPRPGRTSLGLVASHY